MVWKKVAKIIGNADAVRKWLNKDPRFIQGTYEYYIIPVDKNNKRVKQNARVISGLGKGYTAYCYLIYAQPKKDFKYIKKKQPFLDMGAGAVPHPYATDAVDIADKKWNLKEIKRTYEPEGEMTVDKYNKRLENGLIYHYKFDFNRRKLPYPNNHFRTIYMKSNLFGSSHAFKEARRVLKYGGNIIIHYTFTKEARNEWLQKLIRYGFSNPHFKILQTMYAKQSTKFAPKGLRMDEAIIIATKK